MSISINSELESRLRARAEAQGLTVEAYVERLVRAEQDGEDELEKLAIQGLTSGTPVEVGPGYWEEKHRRLVEQLKKTNNP